MRIIAEFLFLYEINVNIQFELRQYITNSGQCNNLSAARVDPEALQDFATYFLFTTRDSYSARANRASNQSRKMFYTIERSHPHYG